MPHTPDHLPSVRRYLARKFHWLAVVLHFVFGRIITRKRAAVLGLLLAGFQILTPALTYGYFARDVGDRERIMNRKENGIVLKDKNGEVFYRQGTINSSEVPLGEISDIFEQAIIASEDKDFYTHEGYSLRGIAGALYANVLNKDATAYGGSTITQQLVKNQLLTPDKSFVRKYQEVSMAVALEQKYSKAEILEMYLNSVYFGEGAFGIKDAAKAYYGKTPADLDLAESSMLAGLLPAPNIYSPISGDPALGAQQQDRVLGNMVEAGYITAPQQAEAKAAQLQYAGAESDSFLHAQHYALMVIDELRETYGEERVARSGFEVITTLDLNRQKQAEEVVARRVAGFAAAGGRNGSLVAINPRNGDVEALVGSVDWSNQEFGKVNMAMAERQPGSAFKPLYYAEAIDKGIINAATILHDKRTTFGDWTPENYDFRFRGDISVRNALALSLNIPAAEVMEKLGPDAASQAARRMGVSTVTEPEKYGLTLALGTAETRLYEMTNAYAAMANQGMQHRPVLIQSIKDKYGEDIYQRAPAQPEQVLGSDAAFITTSILADNAARAPTFNTALNVAGRPAAVKTGTTNDNRDAWTIGYTPSLAVGVWVGNNENVPMSGLAGSSSAGFIWREVMNTIMDGTPVEQFTPTAGIVQLTVCKGTGGRAERAGSNTYREYFIRGYEPSATCRESDNRPDNRDDRGRGRDEADERRIEPPIREAEIRPQPMPEPVVVQPPEGGRGGENDPPEEPKPDKPPKPDSTDE